MGCVLWLKWGADDEVRVAAAKAALFVAMCPDDGPVIDGMAAGRADGTVGADDWPVLLAKLE